MSSKKQTDECLMWKVSVRAEAAEKWWIFEVYVGCYHRDLNRIEAVALGIFEELMRDGKAPECKNYFVDSIDRYERNIVIMDQGGSVVHKYLKEY